MAACLFALFFIGPILAMTDEDISKKLSQIDDLLSTLRDENAHLKNAVGILKAESKVQSEKIKNMEGHIHHLEHELAIKCDKDKFESFEIHQKMEGSELKQTMAGVSDMKQTLARGSELKQTLVEGSRNGDETRNRRIIPPTTSDGVTKPPTTNKIGFFAAMTNHQEHLGLLQTIIFPEAITNVGNGFDVKTSVFKAPIRGLYFFSANLLTHFNEDFEVQLVKDGSAVIYAFAGNGDTHGTGTLSAVMLLEAGNDVWIRTHNNPGFNDGNVRVYGWRWSWFSGFLITAL